MQSQTINYFYNITHIGCNIGNSLQRPAEWVEYNGTNMFIKLTEYTIRIEHNNKIYNGIYEFNCHWPPTNGSRYGMTIPSSANGFARVYSINNNSGGYFVISPNRKNAEMMVSGTGDPITLWTIGDLLQ